MEGLPHFCKSWWRINFRLATIRDTELKEAAATVSKAVLYVVDKDDNGYRFYRYSSVSCPDGYDLDITK